MLIILGKEKEELLSIFNSLKNKELSKTNINAALAILGNYSELLLIAAASHYRLTTLKALQGRINLSNNLTVAWINHQLDTPIHDQLALPYFNFSTASKPSDEKLCCLSVLASYSSNIQQALTNKITSVIQHQTLYSAKIFAYFPQIKKAQALLFEKKYGARTLKFIQAIIDNDSYALSQHYTFSWSINLKSYCVALAADLQRLDILKKLILNKRFPIQALFLWIGRPHNNGYNIYLTSPCIPIINGMVKTLSGLEKPNESFLSFLSTCITNTTSFKISQRTTRDIMSDIIKFGGIDLLRLVIEKFKIIPMIEDAINDQSFEIFWWLLNYFPQINEDDYIAIERKISCYPIFSKKLSEKLAALQSPSLPELTFYIHHLERIRSISQLMKILSVCNTHKQLGTVADIFEFNTDIQFDISYHFYYDLDRMNQVVTLYQENKHLLIQYKKYPLVIMLESITSFFHLIDDIKNNFNNEKTIEAIFHMQECKKKYGKKLIFSDIMRYYIVIHDRLDLYLQFYTEESDPREIFQIATYHYASKIIQYFNENPNKGHVDCLASMECTPGKSQITPFNLFLSENPNQHSSIKLRRASL